MIKLILTFLTILNFTLIYPQKKITGDQSETKSVIMNSNEVSVIVYNYGSITKPNTLANVADFVWHGLGYFFEFGPLAAAEVVNDNGDTLHIVDDSFVLNTQGDYSLDGAQKWGWLPRAGFANPNQDEIATSNNPDSWPVGWSAWHGEYGDGVIIGNNEAYYVMDDFSNAEFPYYPFPSDSTKRGLGLKAEVRIYQFGGALKDALIVKYKITNESEKDLSKVYFGFQGDPHIGGTLDYSDDRVNYTRTSEIGKRNTIYLWDDDGTGLGGRKTGYVGFKYLKTPGNIDLSSFNPAVYTNSLPNVPKNDSLMWAWFSGGIDSTNTLLTEPSDNIINFGTGPFSLNAGDSTEISIVTFASNNFQDLLNDAVTAFYVSNWPNTGTNVAENGGDINYKINLDSPNSGIINGEVPIDWQYSGNDPNAKVYIDCSLDKGENWKPVAWNIPVDSSFTWNTNNFKDGVNYLLRIISYNDSLNNEYYYDITDSLFTINNSVNAQPELELHSAYKDTTFISSPVEIEWTAQDADNSNLNIKAEYSFNPEGPFATIFDDNYSIGNHTFMWDIKDLPNSDKYYLRLTASDGNSDSSQITGTFKLDYSLESYVTQNFVHSSGIATPELFLQIIDESKVTEDTYEITFDTVNNSKTLNVKNIVTGNILLSGYQLIEETSTPAFDGIKLTVRDKETGINHDKSQFNRDTLNSSVQFIFPPAIGSSKIKVKEDWIIVFNDLDTNSTGEYINPGDSALNQLNNLVVCPFFVINLNDQKATYRIFESIPAIRDNGKWDFDEPIILQPTGETGAVTTYEVKFDFNQDILPHQGDTLRIITDKEITTDDVFRFAVDSANVLTNIKDEKSLASYYLYQNYPNPFNPSTTISYQIPKEGLVTLKIYNVLGEEITTLVNEFKSKGKYNVIFDASSAKGGLASGIYIYQLKVNNFLSSKKLILMK